MSTDTDLKIYYITGYALSDRKAPQSCIVIAKDEDNAKFIILAEYNQNKEFVDLTNITFDNIGIANTGAKEGICCPSYN